MDYFDMIKDRLGAKAKGEITKESSFKELGVDSLDLVDLVYELEEELNVEFADEELMNLKTVQDVLNLIESKK